MSNDHSYKRERDMKDILSKRISSLKEPLLFEKEIEEMRLQTHLKYLKQKSLSLWNQSDKDVIK